MTTSEPPLSAPAASSQALPADQDTHPVVRAGAEALGSTVDEYDIRRADDNPEEWCAECLPRDAAAINAARLVAPAVLRWVVGARFGEQADPLSMWHCCEMCRGRAEVIEWLRRQADEIEGATVNVDRSSVNSAAPASSVPTGTPEPAPRRLPGNQPLVLRDLTITPIPGNPTNGDGDA